MLKYKIVASIGLALSVGTGVFLNLQEKAAIDESRLPPKVAESRAFNRWITNLKNKDMEVEGKEFYLLEERQFYSMESLRVYPMETEEQKNVLEETLEKHQGLSHVVFSPNERMFLDYRNVPKPGATNTEVRLYGLKENKIIDARVLECFARNNCHFDRAYFLTNDYFVIHEVSLANNTVTCGPSEKCVHTFKVHLVDLINNKVRTYLSNEKELILEEWIPEF